MDVAGVGGGGVEVSKSREVDVKADSSVVEKVLGLEEE